MNASRTLTDNCVILVVELSFIKSADFIVSKALLKVMLQFDEFEKK